MVTEFSFLGNLSLLGKHFICIWVGLKQEVKFRHLSSFYKHP